MGRRGVERQRLRMCDPFTPKGREIYQEEGLMLGGRIGYKSPRMRF